MFSISEQVPLQKIADDFILSSGIHLYIKRLDLNHPEISGNKWYKLKYNIDEIKTKKYKTALTFGGAYSNHIAAVAAAGKEFGFNTIGVIRGDEKKSLNQTLQLAEKNGMRLHFISREMYRNKETISFIEGLKELFGDFYLLPEGGSNELAVKGCSEILNNETDPFDYVCCSCGTGATLAGVILSLKANQQAIGFSSLKGGKILEDNVRKYIGDHSNDWSINHDFHFGGYAKTTPELLNFVKQFKKQNNIPLDNIYTGKMVSGIYDLIKKGYFKRDQKIIALHTGGIQGNSNDLLVS
jgi:1-aminocyclopropane-1-carboxylate deaminase